MKGAGRSVIITIRPLTIDDLKLPDDELGRLFLDICVAAEAENQGLCTDPVPKGFSRRVTALYREIKAEHARNSTVADVLRMTANGDFCTAGRFLKEHMDTGAKIMAKENLLTKQIQTRLMGQKAGGAKTRDVTKTENADRNRRICSANEQLLKANKSPRSIPGILATRFDLSARQIKRIIRQD